MSTEILKVQLVQEESKKIDLLLFLKEAFKQKILFSSIVVLFIIAGILFQLTTPEKWVASIVVSPPDTATFEEYNRAMHIIAAEHTIKDSSADLFLKFKEAIGDKDYIDFKSLNLGNRFKIEPVDRSNSLNVISYTDSNEAVAQQKLKSLLDETTSIFMSNEFNKVESLIKIKQEDLEELEKNKAALITNLFYASQIRALKKLNWTSQFKNLKPYKIVSSDKIEVSKIFPKPKLILLFSFITGLMFALLICSIKTVITKNDIFSK